MRRGVFAAAVFATACGPATETEHVAATAVDHGRAVFADPAVAGTSFNTFACATCHSVEVGERAHDPGAPMRGVVHRPLYWGGQEVDLLASANHCLETFMLRARPWTAEDADARAMWAFLESISTDDRGTDPVPFTVPAAIADLPAGDAGRGAASYSTACARCHGAAHTGEGKLAARAPTLPEQSIADHPEPEYSATDRRLVFVQKTRHGSFYGYGGQMPPLSREALPDADLADILAYLGLY